MLEVVVDLALETGISLRRRVSGFQHQDQRHQGFGDEAAAKFAKPAATVRPGTQRVFKKLVHAKAVAQRSEEIKTGAPIARGRSGCSSSFPEFWASAVG